MIAEDVYFTVDVEMGSKQFMPASRDSKTRANKNLQGFPLFEHERCLAGYGKTWFISFEYLSSLYAYLLAIFDECV